MKPISVGIHKTNIYPQPAKRRAVEAAEPKKRQSKLAKEHNITADEEGQIKEAFDLFAEKPPGEKESMIPINDVRRAMMYAPISLKFLL